MLFGSTRDGRFQDNNIIELPSNEGSEGLKTLVQELITWKPDTKNPTDCVMALWFCELRAREIIGNGRFNQTHVYNKWATQKQIDTRYSVNVTDYEMSVYEQDVDVIRY